MATIQHFTTEQALEIGNKLGIDWGPLERRAIPHRIKC
jgi:hypothetical protein